ncbi:MAG: hypothetical protein IJO56_02075 [Oscillospiraceae bacterium]|nr:hypothetical protein [Oscillospiraceae bacterium]
MTPVETIIAVIFILLVLGIFVALVLIFEAIGVPRIVMILVGMLLFFLAYKILIPILSRYVSKQSANHKGEVIYYTDINVFSIKARNSYVASFLEIAPEEKISVGYDPAKLTYTGVTIGAATVGNFNLQNESANLKSYRTGNFFLKFKDDEYYPVKKIRLADNLLNEAKQNPFISQYLSGNELILWSVGRSMNESEKTATDYLTKQGDLESATKAFNIMSLSDSCSLLSRKDCEKIMKWLSGKLNY